MAFAVLFQALIVPLYFGLTVTFLFLVLIKELQVLAGAANIHQCPLESG